MHLADKWSAACYVYIVLLLSCGGVGSASLPRGVVGLYVVYDCGISRSYSLVFSLNLTQQ